MRAFVFVGALFLLLSNRASAQTVTVHVVGDSGVLERADPSNRTWSELCTTPCTTVLPANSLVRINGVAVMTSAPFALPHGDHLTLRALVRTTHDDRIAKQTMWAGVVVTGVGGGVLVAGVWTAFALFASHCGPVFSCQPYDATVPAVMTLVGGLVALVGAVILGDGIEGRGRSRLMLVF